MTSTAVSGGTSMRKRRAGLVDEVVPVVLDGVEHRLTFGDGHLERVRPAAVDGRGPHPRQRHHTRGRRRGVDPDEVGTLGHAGRRDDVLLGGVPGTGDLVGAHREHGERPEDADGDEHRHQDAGDGDR
ncbi:hypothetical protein QP028_13300 [Corynebacterium suedekumii]|nr:hypothetical protein QP028_13300 [Corynebacterium suedekumii]